MSPTLEEGIYRIVEHDGTRTVLELSDASHPVFKAHFENNPILPGFMQIDIIAAVMKKRVRAISMAKFMKPVLPGMTLIYTVAEGEKTTRIRVQGVQGESFSDIKLLWSDL